MAIGSLTQIFSLIYLATWTVEDNIKDPLLIIVPNNITINLPDFCPRMKSCSNGVHIACIFDPFYTNRLGPRCDRGQNITLSERNQNNILALINNIRGRVASGKETGKNGVQIHRAYRMPQLDWDTHLAAFAQILANQCIFKHDICHATYKFRNPGQAIGLLRFSYPDWLTVSRTGPTGQFTEMDDRVEYAIRHIIKRWYRQKTNVTNDMIYKSPAGSRRQFLKDLSGCRLYLQMISGRTTHIGCGVSAYTHYTGAIKGQFYNVIQLVCNFSHKPMLNDFIFDIYNENDSECGCDPNVGHSEDCLCHIYYDLSTKEPDVTTKKPEKVISRVNILPIIVSGNDSDEQLLLDEINKLSTSKPKRKKGTRRENSDEQTSSEEYYDSELYLKNVSNIERNLYYDIDFEPPNHGEDFVDDSSVDDAYYRRAKDLETYTGLSIEDRYNFFLKRRPIRRYYQGGELY